MTDKTICENLHVQLWFVVESILRKYSNPPDKQEKAMPAVLEQAEVLSEIRAEVS